MRFRFLLILFLSFYNYTAFAQKIKTLLTIDGETVSSKEFLKLYNKNIDLVKEESQKEVDSYLKLFIDYKLKLKEAKRLGLNDDANYKREFESYKKQLTKSYLSDNKVTDALVKEAYERLSFDVKASHILILDKPNQTDTLVAYNKLLDYRKILKNEGFEKTKQKLYIKDSVLVEDLGYFSAFKMVYDFESMAFNTKTGEVSMPFKTNFGYHIVRVDEKRPSRGTVTTAHIMIALNSKSDNLKPEERINQIYSKLQQGENFESLAKQFSDDKSTARVGGKLKPFKSGQLSSTTFEDAAFNLKNIGDYSKPIKSEFGWHIIKLIKKESLEPFEKMKSTLEAQVKRDQRSKLINSAMVKELSKHYKIKKNKTTKAYFENALGETYLKGKIELPKDYDESKVVISVNDLVYTNTDFLKFLKSKQRSYSRQKTTLKNVLDTELPLFYEQSILKFREANLANENEEFADVIKEYRDGLLLFALMEKEIWNKASKDSIGLKEYYGTHKENYTWNDRVDATIFSVSNKEIANDIQKMLESNKTEDDIKAKYNTGEKQNIIFTSGIFEKSNPKLPVNLKFSKGISKVYQHNDGFHVFDVKNVLKANNKTLKEARDNVVNDYQTQIEKDWLKSLREKFKVEVNKKQLKRLKSKIGK